MNQFKSQLRSLYLNESFKNRCISNYVNAENPLARIQTQQALDEYAEAFKLMANDCRLQGCNLHQIESAILRVSELGLLFNPNAKHIYLNVYWPESGPCVLNVELGYRGMERLTMTSGKISRFFYQLVYDTDDFIWRSPSQLPVYTSTSDTSNRTPIGGYVVFVYNNKDVLCYRVEADELQEIAKKDRLRYKEFPEYQAFEQSLYDTPWSKRMYEIALWRLAFIRYREIILAKQNCLNPDGTINTTDEDKTPEVDEIFG